MFECGAFSSFPDKSSAVPSRCASAYREINSDAAIKAIKSNCVGVFVIEDIVSSEAVFIVTVSRRVTNPSLPQVVNLEDRVDDGEAAACGNGGVLVVDVNGKFLRMRVDEHELGVGHGICVVDASSVKFSSAPPF